MNYTDVAEDQMQILTMDKKIGTNVRSYKNKIRTYTNTTAAANVAIVDGECCLGCSSSTTTINFYNGYISEIMIFASQLSDAERNVIFDYLLRKHQIS